MWLTRNIIHIVHRTPVHRSVVSVDNKIGFIYINPVAYQLSIEISRFQRYQQR